MQLITDHLTLVGLTKVSNPDISAACLSDLDQLERRINFRCALNKLWDELKELLSKGFKVRFLGVHMAQKLLEVVGLACACHTRVANACSSWKSSARLQ